MKIAAAVETSVGAPAFGAATSSSVASVVELHEDGCEGARDSEPACRQIEKEAVHPDCDIPRCGYFHNFPDARLSEMTERLTVGRAAAAGSTVK